MLYGVFSHEVPTMIPTASSTLMRHSRVTLFLYGVLNVFLSRFCIEYSIENDPTFMFSEDKTKHVEIYGTKMALRRVKLRIYYIYSNNDTC